MKFIGKRFINNCFVNHYWTKKLFFCISKNCKQQGFFSLKKYNKNEWMNWNITSNRANVKYNNMMT